MRHTHQAMHCSTNHSKKTHKERRTVRIILPGEEDRDSRQTSHRSLSQSDVECFEYQPSHHRSKSIDLSKYVVTLMDPQLPIDSHLDKRSQKLLKEGNGAKKSTKGKGLNQSIYEKEVFHWTTTSVRTLQMQSQKQINERVPEKPKGILKQTSSYSKDKSKEEQTKKKEPSKKMSNSNAQKSKIHSLIMKEKTQQNQIAWKQQKLAIKKEDLSASTFKGFKLSNEECLIYEFNNRGLKQYKGEELKTISQDLRLQVLKSKLLEQGILL